MDREVLFRQLNMHRATAAAISLGQVIATNPSVCLLQEPFTAFGRVARIPANHKCIPGTALVSRPRAAILVPKDIPYVSLEQLSHPDMAVALLNLVRGKVLIASVYLDYNRPVVQPWLQKLMDFADTKQYPIILGFDSNAHSLLYGPDSNERGEIFEEFILQHNLKVENVGEKQTFHAFRGNSGIGSCIDVTLSRGLIPINDWQVRDMEFNGSDHHTLTWSVPLSIPKPIKIRPWHSAKWDVFKAKMAEHTFNYPENFTTRKIDKFLQRFNKVIYDALDLACPTRDAKASPIEIKWFGKDQKRLLNRTKKKFAAYRRNTTRAKKKSLARARRIYMRSCR